MNPSPIRARNRKSGVQQKDMGLELSLGLEATAGGGGLSTEGRILLRTLRNSLGSLSYPLIHFLAVLSLLLKLANASCSVVYTSNIWSRRDHFRTS